MKIQSAYKANAFDGVFHPTWKKILLDFDKNFFAPNFGAS